MKLRLGKIIFASDSVGRLFLCDCKEASWLLELASSLALLFTNETLQYQEWMCFMCQNCTSLMSKLDTDGILSIFDFSYLCKVILLSSMPLFLNC